MRPVRSSPGAGQSNIPLRANLLNLAWRASETKDSGRGSHQLAVHQSRYLPELPLFRGALSLCEQVEERTGVHRHGDSTGERRGQDVAS